MSSLRAKLGLGAVALFAGGLGLLLAANAFFMEPFYVARTRGSFLAIRDRMTAAPRDHHAELALARSLAARSGYKIVVADREGTVQVSSVPEFVEGSRFPLPKDQLEFFRQRRGSLEQGETLFGVLDAAPRGQSVLQLLSALGADRFLVVTQPLEELRRSMAAASPFFLLVGSLVLLLELVLVLALSRGLTGPILELSRVARRVAAGELNARSGRRGKDELGVLGQSVDAMAASLARSIEELSAANAELARKVRAQEDFIAGAAHELKTPVGLVRGYAEAIRLGLYGSDEERAELAEIILKEADHLDRLVRDLAAIALANAAAHGSPGGLALELTDGDVSQTLQRAAERFALAAKQKGVRLEVSRGGALGARFDADRLVQVLDNLLSNALRHSPEGGMVKLHGSVDGAFVRVEVENEGEKVPEERLARLFEPFYRADASRSRASGGSGLGLALVRSLVEAQGGSCGARNGPRGPVFWLTLPGRPSASS